ncbi:MAG TPA: rhomboid family intramembrane serine protease [Candidatus Saccharimonadales bacterium]|jgi:membrane associated rhomboid family serine protease|nr:rhomboid family intramembrane serine protease [Candidatus Saccharimonadales bacterium]
MIPLRDDAPRYTRPYVTYLFIVLNLAIFLFQDSLTPRLHRAFDFQFGFVPGRVGAWLEGSVPLEAALVPALTSMFLHYGWLHLIFNMWFLYIFGDNVEDRLGHFRFLFFYAASGLGGILLHFAFNAGSTVPTIGASGAIAGVMGAYFLLFPTARVLTLIPLFLIFPIVWLPAWVYLAYWFVGQFISGAASAMTSVQQTGGVAFWAHVGGFIGGIGLIKLLPARSRYGMYEPA